MRVNSLPVKPGLRGDVHTSVNLGRILLLILSRVCHNNLHIHLTDPCLYFCDYGLMCIMCVKLDTLSDGQILSMKGDLSEHLRKTSRLCFTIFSSQHSTFIITGFVPAVNIHTTNPLYQKWHYFSNTCRSVFLCLVALLKPEC